MGCLTQVIVHYLLEEIGVRAAFPHSSLQEVTCFGIGHPQIRNRTIEEVVVGTIVLALV
jgi:hypothetical protein